ncbi:MAG: hypothetical protein R6W78_06315 [Bacteroidales bacterium]
MRFIKSILPFAIIALFISFSTSSCKRTPSGNAGDTTAFAKDSLLAEVKEVVYPLPGPFELYKKLEHIGASYLGKVLNPVENIDKYYTEKNKALNLGTYASDLSYVSTYNKNQEIQLYSRNLKTLMNDLNVNINFSDFYSEEMKNKLENKDTLVKVITNVYFDAYKEMSSKGDPSLAALMLTGIWVEGLYIASHISDDTYNNNDIVKIILDQKNSLKIVLDMLEKTSGNEITDSLAKALGNVKAIYDQAGESITKDQLDTLTRAIEEIRASIIS